LKNKKKVFVGITGASGSIYGLRLIQELVKRAYFVEICFSKSGLQIARFETGIRFSDDASSLREDLVTNLSVKASRIIVFNENNFFSEPASGSNKYDAVFIVPCSMSSVAHIAYGTTRNLIQRAAEVALKQGYPLVLVPRETPVSLIHLRAMTVAAESGAKIVLPVPAFYQKPKSIDHIINFVVGKVLDAVGIENKLYRRWNPND